MQTRTSDFVSGVLGIIFLFQLHCKIERSVLEIYEEFFFEKLKAYLLKHFGMRIMMNLNLGLANNTSNHTANLIFPTRLKIYIYYNLHMYLLLLVLLFVITLNYRCSLSLYLSILCPPEKLKSKKLFWRGVGGLEESFYFLDQIMI